MTTTLPYTVKISGSAVNVLAGTLDVTNQLGQRSVARFQVWDTSGATVYLQGAHVEIYDEANALIYGGFVESDALTKPGFAATLVHDITCKDYNYLADKRLAARSYLNQSAGSIVSDLFTHYLQAEGVTITSSSIATGPTIPEVIFTYEPVSKCLDAICQQSGYWWDIDVNKVLFFQPYGGTNAPFVLDGTQVDQTKNLTYTEGNPQYVNRQFVVGAYGTTAQQTETKHGDSTTRAFTFSYEMAKVPTITVNGLPQSVGIKGVDIGKVWYWAEGDATLAQDPTQAVLGVSDTLSVTYYGRFPIVAMAQDAGLITTQKALEATGTGYVESKYTNKKIKTLSGAFQIAGTLLAHYGQRMRTLQFWTQKKGLAPGQLLTVNLAMMNLANTQMLVQTVEITDGAEDGLNIWFNVSCLGSPYDVTWQTLFQQLANQDQPLDNILVGDNSAISVLTQWTAAWNWTMGSVTSTKTACPICGTGTLCGLSTIVC